LPARDVKWSSGKFSTIIATAATSGRISLYDVNVGGASKLELAYLHEHTNQINKLDFDPFAGYLLLSASQDKSVRLWDLRDGKRDRSRLRFEPRIPVRDVRWSPSEPLDFAVCTDSGVIQKWDARSPLGPKLSINGHEKACYSIDWHPDGRHVTSGGFDKYIRVWDFQNDNKRQKPVFQLRAPSGIRNVRWRPPSRASETTKTGHWQSTQIAVSYTHDDPRIHIWDLRRPWLPFRELDRYSSAANDLLWATKDKLWTVGDEGVFTQWDLKHGTPFYNEISPCASTFTPDGEYYMFSERREPSRTLGAEDPALGFLSIPRDKLSSGDDPTASRSLTDDENALETHLSSTTHSRAERGILSSKSSKSQANSPPSVEDKPPILSLDRAVFQRPDLYNNDQFGTASCVPGKATELETVEYLASNYATPSTAEERVQCPDTILERLEAAFRQNAVACDAVSLHRMAQSWRILSAVLVPELRDWADSNRSRRRAEAGKRREMLEQFRSGSNPSILSPLPGLPGRGTKAKGDGKSLKLMSSLLKSTVESDRPFHSDSTSNVTTPLAKPFRSSPYSSRRGWSKLASDEDEIDDVLTLPPSVLSSHSTAAAAARALVDSPGRRTGSVPSSPDVNRRSATTSSKDHNPHKNTDGVRDTDTSSSARGIPAQATTQDDRRAALRDYRMQARPIFTLEGSAYRAAIHPRQDSDESFQMFSASGGSSQRARSLGQSFEYLGDDAKPHNQSTETLHYSEQDDETGEDRDLSFGESHVQRVNGQTRSIMQPSNIPDSVALETPPDMSFGSDAPTRVHGQGSSKNDQGAWDVEQEANSIPTSEFHTALSSTPDIFHFEGTSLDKPRIYTSNPLRMSEAHVAGSEKFPGHQAGFPNSMSMDDLDCATYLISDFRPIDLFSYEPKSPFAWSSLPLICQSIAFDVENGIGHSQFAAHLLMHVHPYFFDASFRQLKGVEPGGTNNLADRLMTPHLGHRIIESIFDTHLSFLRQVQLMGSAAILRKMCVEFEYPRLYVSAGGDQEAGSSLTDGDAASLSIVCTTCHGQMPAGKNTCERCQRVRSVCPICLSMHGVDQEVSDPADSRDNAGSGRAWKWGSNGKMWAFCQACGHSGHVRCLKEWFAEQSSNGTCPTQGCGCDCGPGTTRESRIQQQIKQEEEVRLIRGLNGNRGGGGGGSTKRDSLRAGGSPAVDKARAALRKSITGERATQSGDERSLAGKRMSSANRGQMLGFGSSRKSVRLVTPGEDSGGGRGQSASRS